MIPGSETLKNAQDPGAGKQSWAPLTRITLERYNLIFSQVHSRGYGSEGQPQHDAATCLEGGKAILVKVALVSGNLLFTKWSVASGLERDNVQIVADANISDTARPSIEALTTGGGAITIVQVFYVGESDANIHYILSQDGGDSFGAEQNVGALANVKAIASVSTARVHAVSYANGNSRFHCFELNGAWAKTDSLIYWPHKIEHIDAITIGGRDLIVFYSPGPMYGDYLEAGIYGIWVKHGRWSDIFKIDVLDEADAYAYRQHPMISTANGIYFLTGYLSEGDEDYSHQTRFLKTSKDGQNWSQYMPLVTCPEAGPAKLLVINAASGQSWPWDTGKQVYLIGYDKVYESDATRLVGEINTALQVDVTSRTRNWALERGAVSIGNTVLSNHDGALDAHAIINADNTLLLIREAGYHTGAGDEYAQITLEVVDFIKETDELPQRHKQVVSRDFMAWVRDREADHFEWWESQLVGYDNYDDDTETGYGGLGHTATQKGWWETKNNVLWLRSNNEMGLVFTTWDSKIMNGQTKAMIRVETAGNNEYAGVVFRAKDEGNFWATYYNQATDKIVLRQRHGGSWLSVAAQSPGAPGWGADTWYGIMVDFRYSYVRVFRSTDGKTWTLDFAHVITPNALNPPPEYGYTGLIGCGYSSEDEDESADYTPPTPGPEDLGPVGPAVAGHSVDGFYFTDSLGNEWEQRNTGLTDTDILDLIWDPWWHTSERQGTNDSGQVIVLACGVGWIAKKVGANAWEDVTPTENPPNTWEDSTAPTATTVTYKQLHADIHHLDVFFCLVEWQEVDSGNEKWRAWIAKTVDNGKSWAWVPLCVGYENGGVCSNVTLDFTEAEMPDNTWIGTGQEMLDCGYPFGLGTCGLSQEMGTHVPSSGVQGVNCGGGRRRCCVKVGMTVSSPPAGTKTQLSVTRAWYGGGSVFDIRGYDGSWHDLGNDSVVIPFGVTYTEIALTAGSDVGTDSELWTFTVTCGADGLGEVRPLAMDIDTEDGSRVYLTLWSAGNKIYCQRRATSDLSVEGTTEVGSATEAEIADKTYFVVPRCPHVPAETGFGNWLWLFGRWNDGAVKHLAFSNNGGATLINKGSGSWDSNHRIGALDVLGDGNTVYAFINHATTPRLWTTPDGGTTWQDLNSVPFNVEFDALSRATWSEDEEFLIGNSAAAAQMAAWLGKPYTDDWEDATGDPGLPTEAGFISAIIWV